MHLESELRVIFLLGFVQIFMLSTILYHTFKGFQQSNEKKILFSAFLMYLLYIVFRLVSFQNEEHSLYAYTSAVKMLSHLFKALFFLIFGYLVLRAVITEPLLKKILDTNTYLALALITLLTLFVILFEDGAEGILSLNIELSNELIVVTLQILILNVIYHSWKVSRLRKLELYFIAFLVFTFATTIHLFYVYQGITGPHFYVMWLIYTIAVGILLYSTFRKE